MWKHKVERHPQPPSRQPHAVPIQDLKADNMDQHGHQGAPGDLQGPTPGIAVAQPARKMRSDTSKVSWIKHEGMHKACQMTSEN